jgi:hypothetical protein
MITATPVGKAQKYKNRNDCVYCLDSGLILSEDANPLAYRCRCPSGDQVPEYVQRWSGAMKRVVPTFAELNWRNK